MGEVAVGPQSSAIIRALIGNMIDCGGKLESNL